METLRDKQRVFGDCIQTQSLLTIQSLELEVPKVGASLFEILICMKSSEDEDRNLFIGVDHDHRGPGVLFVFHKSNEQESRGVLPVLPLYLEHLHGPRIWGWFNERAKEMTQGWKYDPKRGEVISEEDNYTSEMVKDDDCVGFELEDVDQNTEDVVFSFNNIKIDLNGLGSGNYYGDNGTIQSGAEDKPSGHHDTTEKGDTNEMDDTNETGEDSGESTAERPTEGTSTPPSKWKVLEQAVLAINPEVDQKLMMELQQTLSKLKQAAQSGEAPVKIPDDGTPSRQE